MANPDIDESLGLEKVEEGGDTQLYHRTDPTLVNPPTTAVSDIGFQGVNGFLNVVYDPEADPGEEAEDANLDIALINGMLYSKSIDPTSDKGKWIKNILDSMKTKSYRIFYQKSDGKNAFPLDSCRGFIIWDFENEIVHYISPNKIQLLINMKYPLSIFSVGFDNIFSIESYYNMSEDDLA